MQIPPLNRRELLTSLGLVAIAGCTQGSPEEPAGTTRPSTTEPSSTSTDAPTDTPTQATSPPPTTTEGDSTTEAVSETEEPTRTTTRSRADVLLDRAEADLEDAVAVYVSQESDADATILDVDARSSGFSAGEVVVETNEVLRDLEDADGKTEERHRERLAALRSARSFIRYAAAAQGHVVAAYSELEAAREKLDDEVYGLDEHAVAIKGGTDDAGTALENLRAESDADSLNHVAFLSADDYDRKIAQLESEASWLEALSDALPELDDGMRLFQGSWEEYHDHDDTYYQFEEPPFEEAAEALEGDGVPESLVEDVEALRCLADSRADAATYMQGAATAQVDGDPSTASDYEEDAEAALERCSEE